MHRKYTTYRRWPPTPSTRRRATSAVTSRPRQRRSWLLLGDAGWVAVRNRVPRLAAEYSVAEAHVRRMVYRQRDEVPAVLAPVHDAPALAHPVPGLPGYLGAEVRFAVTHEQAGTWPTRWSATATARSRNPTGGAGAAPAVTAVLAPTLEWDEADRAREVDTQSSELARDQAALHAAVP